MFWRTRADYHRVMRFLVPVVVGGVLIGLRYWNELNAVPWPIQLGFVAFVALAVGFVVGRRGWLAALAAFVIGHGLWVAVELRPSLPWSASDVWGWDQWGIFIVTLLPTALGAAVLGGLGGWIARRTHVRPAYSGTTT
jgi:hypothetical protein